MSSPIKPTEYYYHNYQFSPQGLHQQLNQTAAPPPAVTPPTSAPQVYQYHPHMYQQPQPQQQQQLGHQQPQATQEKHSQGVYVQIPQHTIAPSGYQHPIASPPHVSPPHITPLHTSSTSPMVQRMTPETPQRYHDVQAAPSTVALISEPAKWPAETTNEPHSQTTSYSHSYLPTSSRSRRRSAPKFVADVKYPVNYPAHMVPPEMQVPTGPPNGWTVVPPRPEDIRPRRYASGVDERNFFTVLEYEINSQPIIWDYYTGYVHLTGIWKAIGNSKADIVKLLDNSPELEPVIKRVRGGFLKIQGTWVPFDVARRLATHVCYYIRFALVPLFGTGFPEQCTKPNEPGFGMLQLNMPVKKAEDASHHHQHHQHQPPQVSVASPTSKARTLAPAVPGSHPPFKVHHQGHHGTQHSRHSSDNGFKRRGTSSRTRTNSNPSTNFLRRDSLRHSLSAHPDVYDEEVFEDEDADWVSPPPLPRKVSFSDEQTISGCPSEFLAMLKATRSLQHLSAGRPIKDIGGDFECGGRQFVWDGSDRLEILPSGKTVAIKDVTPPKMEVLSKDQLPLAVATPPRPEPTPPIESHSENDRRLPSLAKILNM